MQRLVGSAGQAALPLQRSCGRAITLGLLISSIGSSQTTTLHVIRSEKTTTRYIHNVWQTDDGLPGSIVKAILQTRDGYLWLGTDRGVARFDGTQFTTFDIWSTKELKRNMVESLFEDSKSALWIGTGGGGLSRYDGKSFADYRLSASQSNDFVNCLFVDRDGSLWAGTERGGLNRIQKSAIVVFGQREGLPVEYLRTVFEDRSGTLWIGTNGGGVCRYREGKFTTLTTKDGLPSDFVRPILQDRKGDVWIGPGRGGLLSHSKGSFRKRKPES